MDISEAPVLFPGSLSEGDEGPISYFNVDGGM
jgi:hypothetical protein